MNGYPSMSRASLSLLMAQLTLLSLLSMAVSPVYVAGQGPSEGFTNITPLENEASVKAYHLDGSLVTSDSPAMLNESINCTAGIDWQAVPLPWNTVEMVCYILPPGSNPAQYETSALGNLSSTTEVPCPTELSVMDQCFSVTWDGTHLNQPGEWYFVAVFKLNGEPVALAGDDFRVYSFLVVPEFMLGSIAAVGSSVAALMLYKRKRQ